jgi:hypothetical protein
MNNIEKWIKLSLANDIKPGVSVSIQGDRKNGTYIVKDIDPTTKKVTLTDTNGNIVGANLNITADMLTNLDAFHDFQNNDVLIYNKQLYRFDEATNELIMIDRNTLKDVNNGQYRIKANPAVIKGSTKMNSDDLNRIKARNFAGNTLVDGAIVELQGTLLEYRQTNPPVFYRLDEDLKYIGTPIAEGDVPLNMLKVLNQQQIATLKFKAKNKANPQHKVGDRVIVTDTTGAVTIGVINDLDTAGNMVLGKDDGTTVNLEASRIKNIRNYGSSPTGASAGKVYAQLDPKLKGRLEKVVADISKQFRGSNSLGTINSILNMLTTSVCEVDGYSNLYTTMNFGQLGIYNMPNRYVKAVRQVNGNWVPTLDINSYVRSNRIKLPGLSAPNYQNNPVADIIQYLLSKTNKMLW